MPAKELAQCDYASLGQAKQSQPYSAPEINQLEKQTYHSFKE